MARGSVAAGSAASAASASGSGACTAAAPQGRQLLLPGLVLVRQRPGSAKGVVFFTIEDEFGIANLVVYPDITRAHRAAVVAARLILAEGRVERSESGEVPIIHLIVRRLTDRSDLLDGLHLLDGSPEAPWRHALARADGVRRPDSHRRLPVRSRDFH